MNGVFVGYSSVEELYQNGGYDVSNFKNFSDFPDQFVYNTSNSQTYASANSRQLSSATSFAYKRGVLTSKIVYNASGQTISEVENTYTSLDPLTQNCLSLKVVPFTYIYGSSITVWIYGLYYSDFENYRLTKSVQTIHDQSDPTKTTQQTYNFTYSPQDHRLVQLTSSTDSKGLTYTVTDFHTADLGIPSVTSSSETDAIAWMLSKNKSNVVIHTVSARNGLSSVTHFTYNKFLDVNSNTKTFLVSKSSYLNTNTQQKVIQYEYDANNAQTTSSNQVGGKQYSSKYGYNNSYVVAKVVNALNSATYTASQANQSSYIYFTGGTTGSKTVTFSSLYAGNIQISIPVGSWLGGTGTVTMSGSYTLTGPATSSNTLCQSSTTTNCNYPSSISLNNMPAGNYSLTFWATTNTASASNTVPIQVTYPANQMSLVAQPEFFYEGFESNPGATSGTAHTGTAYWASDYTVYYTPPNGRSYVIQWWNLVAGKWIFNEQPFTGTSMSLTGPVDDIRIFPSDALMTTYAYLPLVGITGETDPSGKSLFYSYDALNRLQSIRDQDNNIVKQFDYQFQLLSSPVYNAAQSGPFTKTNCPSGYSGLSFTYTVPANKYSSLISVDDANQQAVNDVNSNGPAYANSQPNATGCVVVSNPTITCINNTGQSGYTVKFTNTATNQVYSLNLPATQGTISLPAGNYNLTVTTTLTNGIIATFCSSTASTPGVTQTSVSITNLNISTTGCLTLTVDSKA
jgi:YD repeat-containing protein